MQNNTNFPFNLLVCFFLSCFSRLNPQSTVGVTGFRLISTPLRPCFVGGQPVLALLLLPPTWVLQNIQLKDQLCIPHIATPTQRFLPLCTGQVRLRAQNQVSGRVGWPS